MKKRNKILSALLAATMLTPTVGAVDLSDDKIWGDFNGTSEVVELYSIVPPKVITVDMLKQLRCIDYATGKLTTLTPSGDDVLLIGGHEMPGVTKPAKDVRWTFNDTDKVYAVERSNGLGFRAATYEEVESLPTECEDIKYEGDIPISATYRERKVDYSYDQFGRLDSITTRAGKNEWIYETESFSIYPQRGEASIKDEDTDEVLYYGDEFTFEVVTALCVDEISIEADGIYDDLTYEVLVDEYDLDWYDNGDGQTKTWTVSLPLYTTGDRTFKIITDERDFDLEIEATVYEADFEVDDVCKHSRYTTKNDTIRYYKDPTYHYVNEQKIYICSDCDAEFDMENDVYSEKHIFLNNSCIECKYVNQTQSFGPTPQQGDAAVTVNGRYVQFDVPPKIINSRTMIPLRAVTEALGAEVTWKPSKSYITASPDILIKYDNPYAAGEWLCMELNVNVTKVHWMKVLPNDVIYDSGEFYLDSSPVIVDDRTLVPIRAIAELMGYTVEWDDSTKTAIIY